MEKVLMKGNEAIAEAAILAGENTLLTLFTLLFRFLAIFLIGGCLRRKTIEIKCFFAVFYFINGIIIAEKIVIVEIIILSLCHSNYHILSRV